MAQRCTGRQSACIGALLLATAPPGCGTHNPARPSGKPNPTGGSTERPEAADRDGDDILDRCDRCPDAPESYNQYEDADGCPEALTVANTGWGHPIVDAAVFFEHGSAKVAGPSAGAIDQVAITMRDHPDALLVGCVGEAAPGEPDPEGLSQLRAEEVCRLLRERGIAPERLVAHARGDRGPPAQMAETRRRVVILSLEQRAPEWYQGTYELQRWNGRDLEPVEWKVPDRPSGPPTCPLVK